MDYYQGYDDGMYQARSSRGTGLVGFLFRLVLSLVWGAFVYVPLLLLGYWIASRMSSLYSDEILIKISLTLVFAYLGFGFQFFFVQYNLEEFLGNRNVVNFTMWSWLGAVLVSILIYGHYKFMTNIAPASVFPFFNAGFKLMRNPSTGTQVSGVPAKSAAYFENAGMKVSYRRD